MPCRDSTNIIVITKETKKLQKTKHLFFSVIIRTFVSISSESSFHGPMGKPGNVKIIDNGFTLHLPGRR